MSLDPASFKAHTPHLEAGRSVRVQHDCGEGRTMKVENSERGFTAYCWRCSDHGWIPHPAPSFSERMAALRLVKAHDVIATAGVSLPLPREPEPAVWPAEARVWLYKAGMSDDDIRALGFYWNPRLRRVVMPVHADNVLLYWQARGFDKDRPKYINPIVPKDSLIVRFGSGPTLVLTEDILSAYKVGKVTEAWSIMGTSLAEGVLRKIILDGRPVLIALDPDAAGIRGATKIRKVLALFGARVSIARFTRDPKLLSTQDIHHELSSHQMAAR